MIKPLNDDVLLEKVKDQTKGQTETIILKNDEDAENIYFRIRQTGPDVTMVNQGDVVVVPWTRVTNPFREDTDDGFVMVGITSEKEILAVMEGFDDQ